MPLCSDILNDLLLSRRGEDLPFSGIVTTDSRKVEKNGIFAAVPGTSFDGHDFISAAEETAAVIIHSRKLSSYRPDKSYYLVRDSQAAAALLFKEKYGSPELELFGVTGTNGKTTTAFILEHLLDNCGLLSTVEFRNGAASYPATHTTPDPGTLWRILGEMKSNHLTRAAMELSSHSLDQKRAYGLTFRAAIFTNLTGDHLDYHRDMEHYYQAKKSFFTDLLAPGGAAVINVDDSYGRRLAGELAGVCRIITFGTVPEAQWQIRDLESSASGMTFELVSGDTVLPLSSNLAGTYNAFNLAGAVLAVLDSRVSFEKISSRLQQNITVPGRMQFIRSGRGFDCVVDFAHTDDALRNVICALRPLARRIICVFGAGGNRDQSKRPRMGKAAALADFVIVTSDNPRSEDPEKIISDIVAGIPGDVCFETISDRKKAIARALELAGSGDIVLVAGKGHENYQEIRGVKYPFSDQETIQEYLRGDR